MKGQFWRDLKKLSPLILTVVGSAGVVATAIFTAKATPLVLDEIKKKEEEKGEELTVIEKVKAAAPICAPAAGIAVVTIAAIVGSNVLSMKQNLSLAATCTLLQKNFSQYKSKVKKLFGDDADKKVTTEIAKDNEKKYDLLMDPQKAMALELYLWHEPNTCQWFWETEANVLRAENEVNHRINTNGICSLQEYCNLLKIEPSEGSENVGWCYDDFRDNWDEFWVEFNHEFIEEPEEDMPPYWVIHTAISPEYDFAMESRPIPRLEFDEEGRYAIPFDVR